VLRGLERSRPSSQIAVGRMRHESSAGIAERNTMTENETSESAGEKEQKNPLVKVIGDAETVPVFSCQILVSQESGNVVAESANIAGIRVTAKNEREALRAVVTELKALLKDYQDRSEKIPWLDPATEPNDQQQVRFMALHL
jgi:hypothetical protein